MMNVKMLREWLDKQPDEREVKIAVVFNPQDRVLKSIVAVYVEHGIREEDPTTYYLVTSQLIIQ
jgi:hypothetical protein